MKRTLPLIAIIAIVLGACDDRMLPPTKEPTDKTIVYTRNPSLTPPPDFTIMGIGVDALPRQFLMSSAVLAPPARTRMAFMELQSGVPYTAVISVYDTGSSWRRDLRTVNQDQIETAPSISPNGKTVVFKTTNDSIHIVDVDSGIDRPVYFSPDVRRIFHFSPDNSRVAFYGRDESYVGINVGKITVLDLRTGQFTVVADSAAFADVDPLTWSPDGTRLAYLHLGPDFSDMGVSHVSVVTIATGKDVAITEDGQYNLGLAWWPNGDTIAVAGGPTMGERDLWLMSADGSSRRRLVTTPTPEFAPRWSADGSRLLYIEATVLGGPEDLRGDIKVIERTNETPITVGAGVLAANAFWWFVELHPA